MKTLHEREVERLLGVIALRLGSIVLMVGVMLGMVFAIGIKVT